MKVAKGTPVWRFHATLDLVLSDGELAALPPIGQDYILRYAYKDMRTGAYVLCGDDARFFNHSTEPNCGDDPDDASQCLALRDIAVGEELVCDYREFDADAEAKLVSAVAHASAAAH